MGWNNVRLFWARRFGPNRKKAASILSKLDHAMNLAMNPINDEPLTSADKNLVSEIRKKTAENNRNNLTRTNAYLEYYRRHPEVHWALLAHCVSRNGGYGMTDLKGDFFRRIASDEDAKRFFAFLERANWLIFHDAYPQMLLYQEGKKLGENLCHLLAPLGVSKFMFPIWNQFWQAKDSSLLTRALIINEQNYIESRVIKNPLYQTTVESSIQFKLESFLNLNQVLIPYHDGSNIKLAGTTMLHFVSVKDRIRTGLRLYHALFGNDARHQAIVQFLNHVEHSGSRADYWPDVFTSEETDSLSEPYRPRLSQKGGTDGKDIKGGTATGGKQIYSPRLVDAWTDVEHQQAEPGDWFLDLGHAIYLLDEPTKQKLDITDTYRKSIKTMENLILVKEKAERML